MPPIYIAFERKLTGAERELIQEAWRKAHSGLPECDAREDKPRDGWWLAKLALHVSALALSLAALIASVVAVTIAGRIASVVFNVLDW